MLVVVVVVVVVLVLVLVVNVLPQPMRAHFKVRDLLPFGEEIARMPAPCRDEVQFIGSDIHTLHISSYIRILILGHWIMILDDTRICNVLQYFYPILSISIPIGSCDLWRLVATCGFEVSRGQLVRGSIGSMALALAPPANVPWFGLSSLSCHYHVFLFSQCSDEI